MKTKSAKLSPWALTMLRKGKAFKLAEKMPPMPIREAGLWLLQQREVFFWLKYALSNQGAIAYQRKSEEDFFGGSWSGSGGAYRPTRNSIHDPELLIWVARNMPEIRYPEEAPHGAWKIMDTPLAEWVLSQPEIRSGVLNFFLKYGAIMVSGDRVIGAKFEAAKF